jgi:hypothetical protein
MPGKTTIHDPHELPAIVHLIHDCWFDIADVVFHPRQSTLSIRYKRPLRDKVRVVRRRLFALKWTEIPFVECFLEIRHVVESRIEDEQHIRRYDLNTITYETESSVVRVNTGIPTTIVAKVSRFEVSVEETDNVVEIETRRTIFV